jgi:sulfoxide reductase heme-binding subunit YedZ
MAPQVAALLDAKSMWYVTRATGVVSLVLLTASVVLGVTEAVRWASHRWPRFVTAGIHKNVSLTATAFIAVHIATAIVDGFAPIGWLDTVVPFHSAYRPIWLGLGTVAFDLLLAIAITSLLRQRIGHRAWRIVHWAAYACWPVALLHGLGTGSDTTTTSFFTLELVCMAAVVLAVWWRIAAGWPERERQRIFAMAASAIAPVAIALFALAGPLQPGWARRAGTPASLLGGTAPTVADAAAGADASNVQPSEPAPAPSTAGLTPPFDATLEGTESVSGPDRRGNETITIDTTLRGGTSGSLQLVLHGRALEDGGVSLDSSAVTLTASDGSTFTGWVTTLQGVVVNADVQSPGGSSIALELQLGLDGGRVSGTAHGDAR